MFAWLPIIGPIIEGIVSVFNKRADTTVALNKTNRDDDVQEAQISSNMIIAMKDDIGLRLARDIICFPVAVWMSILSWDTIVAKHYPALKFTVADYPPGVQYIPYAVLVFLLGNIGVNTWKRK